VTPVVDSALWWRANRVLDANHDERRANWGGRPVARPSNWISGILDWPRCGGRLYMSAGLTPAVDDRSGKPDLLGESSRLVGATWRVFS